LAVQRVISPTLVQVNPPSTVVVPTDETLNGGAPFPERPIVAGGGLSPNPLTENNCWLLPLGSIRSPRVLNTTLLCHCVAEEPDGTMDTVGGLTGPVIPNPETVPN